MSERWRIPWGRGHSSPESGRRESSVRYQGLRNESPSPRRPASCAPPAQVWMGPSQGQKIEDPGEANLNKICK